MQPPALAGRPEKRQTHNGPKTLMTTAARIISFLSLLNPNRCTGPIFAKELRVASRRRRSYILRTLYLALLMLLMLLIWFEAVDSFDSNPLRTSRMSRAAMIIASSIAWFQFIALQILAVILLSTAISEEIHHRTLSVLMSTPITSRQIVTGKLLSKLLQILHMFAMTLPLLALIRVFGGVPWDYLIATFCITLSTIIFLSCLTLFFSIYFKRAYVVMIFTVVTAGILFGLIPLIFSEGLIPPIFSKFESVSCHISPYLGFARETHAMLNPTIPGTGTAFWWPAASFHWPILCIYLLALCIPVYILACRNVRKAALAHTTARSRRKEEYIPPKIKRKSDILYRPLFLHALIRKTLGTGMIWKEFLTPVLGRFRFLVYGALLLFVLILLLGMLVAVLSGSIAIIGFTLVASVITFFSLAVLFTVIVPAACITSEKESRTWPILLSTPITHNRILAGKLVGIVRRILIAWSPFFFVFALIAHLVDFPFAALIQLLVLALTAMAFLVASGVYFSARLRRTTPAVISNIALAATIWGLVPAIFSAFHQVYRHSNAPPDVVRFIRWMHDLIWNLTPTALAVDLLEYSRHNTIWFYQSPDTLKYWLAYLAIYIPASIILLNRAKANLRRHLT